MGAPEKRGRPKVLQKRHVQKLDRARVRLVKAADSEKRVTWSDVLEGADLDVDVGLRSASDALRAKGVRFRVPRQKAYSSPGDRKKRTIVAKQWKRFSPNFWEHDVLAYVDNKKFPVPRSASQRQHLLQSRCVGHLRKPEEGVQTGFTKPRTKHTFVCPQVDITAAVSARKMLLWHENKSRWSGEVAKEMYEKGLGPALRKAYGDRKRYRILEDGDTTGYQSGKGLAAKRALKIVSMKLPPRTPQWMPLDYNLWTHIERIALKQVKEGETKKQYLARLRWPILYC